MEISVSELNGANAKAAVKVPAKILEQKQDKIAKNVARNAKIDGFRAGKVPMSVVKKRYGDKINQDAEQEVLQEVLTQSLKDLKREAAEVIGEPAIEKFERKDDGLEAEIVISFRPKINIESYEDAIPEFSNPRVTKKEIKEKIDKILESFAPLEPISDKRAIKDGDFVKFDFEGFVDNVPFEGGKAENYVLKIGSNQFIPGFEDGMVGLKADESKDIQVQFPKEYGQKDLAGKDAVFKVKIHEIQEKNIPEEPTEEMLKQLLPQVENPNAEALEEKMKDQIRNEKLDKLYNEELKPKFVDVILEKVNFDLPKNIVEQEIDMQFRNNWGSFSEEEIEEFKKDATKITEKRETFRNDAEKSVKLTFVIDELAKQRKVVVEDQEVIQAIYFEAYQYGQDPKKHLENYKNQGVLPAIKMAMIEDKLFKELFDKKDNKKAE